MLLSKSIALHLLGLFISREIYVDRQRRRLRDIVYPIEYNIYDEMEELNSQKLTARKVYDVVVETARKGIASPIESPRNYMNIVHFDADNQVEIDIAQNYTGIVPISDSNSHSIAEFQENVAGIDVDDYVITTARSANLHVYDLDGF